MPAKVLTTGAVLTDAQVNAAVAALPPLPDNVLVLVRHLNAQVAALTVRVSALEAP